MDSDEDFGRLFEERSREEAKGSKGRDGWEGMNAMSGVEVEEAGEFKLIHPEKRCEGDRVVLALVLIRRSPRGRGGGGVYVDEEVCLDGLVFECNVADLKSGRGGTSSVCVW